MDMKYKCTKDSFKGASHSCVMEFDAYENFDQLSDFYVSFDKSLVFSKEAYFQGGIPRDIWDDYVIWESGKIVSRAAIWKYSPTAWEVAAVSTLPEHRGKGYAEMLVSHCTAIILRNGKVATCTTADNNLTMRRLLEKVGWRAVPADSSSRTLLVE